MFTTMRQGYLPALKQVMQFSPRKTDKPVVVFF